MDQKIINLFDEYTHKPLTREEFIRRLVRLTGSTAAALAVLPLLEVNYVSAQTVSLQDDERINAGIPAYEEALKNSKVAHEIFVYPDVNHAFHNDTAPTRYNEEAAKLAWSRSMKLFEEKLK